jgi:hypothetical protein
MNIFIYEYMNITKLSQNWNRDDIGFNEYGELIYINLGNSYANILLHGSKVIHFDDIRVDEILIKNEKNTSKKEIYHNDFYYIKYDKEIVKLKKYNKIYNPKLKNKSN